MAEQSLANPIADRLRRDILRGHLRPGAPIKERDTAEAMGVSRTPMREAIRILAKEGLVELRPARSPIVALPDVTALSEQAEVLIALEKLAARLACGNAKDRDLEEIGRIVARMAAEFDSVDALDMFEIDMSFHGAIAAASGNGALSDTHRGFQERLWHARFLSARKRRNRDRVVSDHTRILDALRARDADAAETAIDRHLRRLAEDIRSVIEEEILGEKVR